MPSGRATSSSTALAGRSLRDSTASMRSSPCSWAARPSTARRARRRVGACRRSPSARPPLADARQIPPPGVPMMAPRRPLIIPASRRSGQVKTCYGAPVGAAWRWIYYPPIGHGEKFDQVARSPSRFSAPRADWRRGVEAADRRCGQRSWAFRRKIACPAPTGDRLTNIRPEA